MPQWNLLDNSKNLVNLYIFSDVVQTKWLFCVIKDILIKTFWSRNYWDRSHAKALVGIRHNILVCGQYWERIMICPTCTWAQQDIDSSLQDACARVSGKRFQFNHVMLWKILLPLSETTGYKNTGHNNNFSSGILSIIRVQNSSQAFIGNINREINYTMTKPIELFNTMFFFVTIGFPGISLCSLITLRWFLVS